MRVIIQIVPEIQLVIVPCKANMQVIDLFCKAVFGVAVVEGYPSLRLRHLDKPTFDDDFRDGGYVLVGSNLDKNVDYRLRPDSVYGCTANVAYADDFAGRQRGAQSGGYFIILLFPVAVVLGKGYGK